MESKERLYRIIRYLISGGSAAFVTLATLYLLTNKLNVWYQYSAFIAYGLGICVSFTMQKFWTFSHNSVENIRSEIILYLIVAFANLGMNGFLMYLFVERVGMGYIFAEILSAGLIAILSFPVYKKFVFKQAA